MLLVRTELKPSKIHGLGVFVAELVPKGTMTWKFDTACDRLYSPAEMERLPEVFMEILRKHAYVDEKGNRVLCGDNARFENHSDHPSQIYDVQEDADFAAKDLHVGDELTTDYFTFDQESIEAGHVV